MNPFDAVPTPSTKPVLVQSQDRFPRQTVAMARSLISLIGFRDQYTSSHSARVANYVRLIATRLGLGEEETETVAFAAAMHDIGKVGVPDHILLKPDKLNEEEFAWIQQYPQWGSMTLGQVTEFEQAALLIRHMHERIDGSGYPNRLKNEQIPLGSRIIAVADSFDALTTDRPYRAALTHAAAFAEIQRCCGTYFDAEVVNALGVVLQNQLSVRDAS